MSTNILGQLLTDTLTGKDIQYGGSHKLKNIKIKVLNRLNQLLSLHDINNIMLKIMDCAI